MRPQSPARKYNPDPADRVTQVRFIAAVFAQRLGVWNERKLRSYHLAVGKFLEHAADDRLNRVEHILLRDEAHLQVELVELAGRTVGACILVAETRRNLKIAVKACDHDQLLKLLWRLRQRIKFSRVEARGHQIIARAFRRRRGQNGRLEFKKSAFFHAAANRVDHLSAQHDVGMEMLATQVKKAVFEPDLFGIFLLAEYGHRQFCGGSKHLDLVDIDFDLTGRQIRILCARRTPTNLAVNADDPFRTQRLGKLESLAVRIGYDLREPIMVAQINEQHAAMVANAMTPSGQSNGRTNVGVAKSAASM